ncbi:MAG: FAD-dependent oxidoreductase [Bacteroidota bacterium]
MAVNTDFLIVGQGLAGSLMAHELQQAGKSVYVVDQGHRNAASAVAAGIINPITGRYFVKSWLFDALRPVAVETYRSLEKLLGVSFFEERQLVRVLLDAREANAWQSKSSTEGFLPHVMPPQWGEFDAAIQPGVGLSQIQGAAQVYLPILIRAYRERLLEQDSLLEEAFDYDQINWQADGVAYNDIKAKAIVFCEGQQGRLNPYFSQLPFALTKGEVLHCHIPSIQSQRLLKHRLIMAPLPPSEGSHRYWLGANYDKKSIDDTPTPEGFAWLEARLAQMLQVPRSIVGHKAAIRPTTRDRRPLLGQHPQHPQLYLFNGLGTKGASLGPYFARMMRRYLLEGIPLIPEVQFDRTFKADRKKGHQAS